MNQELEKNVRDLLTQIINDKDEHIALMKAELDDYRNKLSAAYGMVDRAQLVAQEYMSKYESSQAIANFNHEIASIDLRGCQDIRANLEKAAEADEKEIARLKAEIAGLRSSAPTDEPTTEPTVQKFKVGDKFALKKHWYVFAAGTVFEITRNEYDTIDACHYYLLKTALGWAAAFPEEWLSELFDIVTPNPEFKAGDRVYLKEELRIGRSMWSCSAGKECYVVKVENNEIYVDFLVTAHRFSVKDVREYFTHTKP